LPLTWLTCSNLAEPRTHGGRVQEAANEYGIDPELWLDLSTGINPGSWPVPPIPSSIWSRLPENNDGLELAAMDYYGTDALLAVAGSQAVIQSLPLMREKSRVLVLHPSYSEHAYAWRTQGHQVSECDASQVETLLPNCEVLVLVNPNNPSGDRFSREQLLAWRDALNQRGGWLIVDEAFIDAQPQQSLMPNSPLDGLIVLRGLGKFFGLAGLRLGFVSAIPSLLTKLSHYLGPWAVNGPARWIGKQALLDRSWQQEMRAHLQLQALRLKTLLNQYSLTPSAGCELFQWIKHPHAREIQRFFSQRAILLRFFNRPLSLRFGLPSDDQEWQKLEGVLSQYARSNFIASDKFKKERGGLKLNFIHDSEKSVYS